MLGGALGLGPQAQRARPLHVRLPNYRTTRSDAADRLFAFGFSRGAFTIRVLVGLIAESGPHPGVKGRELERLAKWAYRAYRRQFNPTGGLVTPLRSLRDWLSAGAGNASRRLRQRGHVRPEIAFVGLWDTVDAYGLPIDEMTRGWDQWVWPLSMAPRRLPANVEKICHALALDDERHTFHPVLLDERREPARDHDRRRDA